MNEIVEQLLAPAPRRQYEDLYEALVTRVDSAGIRFAIPEMGPIEYGPARALEPLYGTAAFAAPDAGVRVLVAFLGGHSSRPVVLGRLDGPTAPVPPWQLQPPAVAR